MSWIPRILVFIVSVAAGILVVNMAQARDRVLLGPLVEFPEVGMAIEQPHGFQKALSFHGLQDYQSGASVMLMSVAAPYARSTEQFFAPGAMRDQGMRLRSRTSVEVSGNPGLLIEVDQIARGVSYRKWIALFGSAEFTHMVTASFPHETAARLNAQMRQVALSAVVADHALSRAKLPFELGDVDGMMAVRSAAGAGRIALYTRDGSLRSDNASDPLFIASPSAQAYQIVDADGFASERLHASGATRIDQVTVKRPVRVNGLPGIEIEAVGRDSQTDTPISIYQMMLFPSAGGFVVMRGTVGVDGHDPYLSRFRQLARTFRATAEERAAR